MPKQSQKMPKGLPKRTRNDRKKINRAASWIRAQAKKLRNKKANDEREKRNKSLDPSERPWAVAKAKRAEIRREGN